MNKSKVSSKIQVYRYAARRAEEIEARCLIDDGQPCDPKIIEAHTIPKRNLRLIAQKDRVWITNSDWKKDFSRPNHDNAPLKWQEYFQLRNINNRLMKARLACRIHDKQVFSKIEDSQLDPQNPEHCLLLAYRSVLVHLHKKRIAAKRFEIMLISDPLSYTLSGLWLKTLLDLGEAERIKTQIEEELFGNVSNTGSEMEHRHVLLQSKSAVAATAVITRDGQHPGFSPLELKEVQRFRIPRSSRAVQITISVYPDQAGQVAVVSFPKESESLASVIVPALKEESENQTEALLSKTLLEETENIMISPTAWDSFSEDKRNRIFEHFINTWSHPVFVATPPGAERMPEYLMTRLTSSHEPDFIDNGDPEEVNLFV